VFPCSLPPKEYSDFIPFRSRDLCFHTPILRICSLPLHIPRRDTLAPRARPMRFFSRFSLFPSFSRPQAPFCFYVRMNGRSFLSPFFLARNRFLLGEPFRYTRSSGPTHFLSLLFISYNIARPENSITALISRARFLTPPLFFRFCSSFSNGELSSLSNRESLVLAFLLVRLSLLDLSLFLRSGFFPPESELTPPWFYFQIPRVSFFPPAMPPVQFPPLIPQSRTVKTVDFLKDEALGLFLTPSHEPSRVYHFPSPFVFFPSFDLTGGPLPSFF